MKYIFLALSILVLFACAPKPAAPVQPTPKPSNIGNTGNPFGPDSPCNQGLSGRRILERAPIRDSTAKTGTVVVNLCVNRKGKVVSAEYAPKGSTTADEHLVRLALENARQYRFEKSREKKQCGNMTFNFQHK
jgi:hypothetical protein